MQAYELPRPPAPLDVVEIRPASRETLYGPCLRVYLELEAPAELTRWRGTLPLPKPPETS